MTCYFFMTEYNFIYFYQSNIIKNEFPNSNYQLELV